MTKFSISRRTFVEGGLGLTVANFLPGTTSIRRCRDDGREHHRGRQERRRSCRQWNDLVALSGADAAGDRRILQTDEYHASARCRISRSSTHRSERWRKRFHAQPQFDFIHIDSNMIPSLASAGYLEPLDEYMKKANFKIDAVGDYGTFMTYGGQTYGIPTDGNVHIQYIRKDLIEDPDNKKRFADKFGKELKFPETWEEEQRHPGIPHGSVQGPLWLGQSAQPGQRRDLVVHDLLQRRRLPVRRRHEADAEHAGRPVRGRHLSERQEGQSPGGGKLGYAAA